VVDEALRGHQDHLKERTIGIDVFHRVPDYDLNADPVVRVTAGEVRKRLAQYYYENEHKDELRIELKPGSYVPAFRIVMEHLHPVGELRVAASKVEYTEPTSQSAVVVPAMPGYEKEVPGPADAQDHSTTSPSKRWGCLRTAVVMSIVALICAGAGEAYLLQASSALDRFWKPVWKGSAPVLISVGSWETQDSRAGSLSMGKHAKSSDPVALSDTITIAKIQHLLSEHSKSSQIQSSTQTSFADLQRGTTILISGFDNAWTMRLTDPLRFHFVAKTPDLLAIEDRSHPGSSDWRIDTRIPYAQLTHDFAIVARFHDPTTEQNIIVAAGIGEDGTIAAGQMVTNEQFLMDAQKTAGEGKDYRNIEAVIETQVIDGKSGPPRVVAVTTW
jgi:hypothetical protein